MDRGQVEDVVKTALAYSEEDASRAYQTKTKWPIIYLCAVLVGTTGMLLNIHHHLLSETLLTSVILGVVSFFSCRKQAAYSSVTFR